MAYWITTHYPHPKPDDHPWHVYVKDIHTDIAKRFKVGDMVLFYESKTFPSLANGAKYPTGREGIVVVGRVTQEAQVRAASKAIMKRSDGRVINWKWGIHTDEKYKSGFVSRKIVNQKLGYKPLNNLRGFGEAHSGVLGISKEQFDYLLDVYKSTPQK